MIVEKSDIRKLSKEQLRDYFLSHQLPAFRGNQVYDWLWHKKADNFDEMSNLPKDIRSFLEIHFEIRKAQVANFQQSTDGTLKNAVKLYDGLVVESVLIPTENRTTACVSSQVGCSLDCTFCATAQLKRMRNLNPDEIYDQVALIDQQSRQYFQKPLSNIVFMGMGEPLMNYNNVQEAIAKITSPEGLAISPKRITLSTSGIPKMIKKMADDNVKYKLAVSLHTALEDVRNQIMPFTTHFPLTELREALQYWYQKTKSRITIEYVVWQNINDNPEAIKALVKFCKHFPCKVNLIEYNPVEGNNFSQASAEILEQYQHALTQANIVVKVRKSRGKDIDAACGQLANKQ